MRTEEIYGYEMLSRFKNEENQPISHHLKYLQLQKHAIEPIH